ncbi:MAG: toll/interleukin-1 receptor domain-containing protein [Candidatus Brocadia sp.]|nr:toll/interleukin-1 receptor domain-containing protein [Candidatus Brocadia sp.]
MAYGRSRNYLFYEGDLDATLRSHFSKIQDRVDAIPEAELFREDEATLVDLVQHDFIIVPLTLDEANLSMTREETKVDVSGDRSRYFSMGDGPHYVAGIRVCISVPFHGDPILWKLKPNQWSSVLPYGDVMSRHGERDGTLEVTIEYLSDMGPEEAKKRFDENMKTVRFYVENQRKQVEGENARLPDLIRSALASRKAKLQKHRDGLERAFGIPIKAAAPTPQDEARAAAPVTRPARKSMPPQHQWDVFLSHASEDKDDFARPLAAALKAKGLHVWFDEFTLRVGDSLRRSIDKGLAGARFGIVLISPKFLEKEWPQKELDALMGRESHGVKVILPVWHNVDAAYVRKFSPLLVDRLASSSSRGMDQVVADLMAAIKGE